MLLPETLQLHDKTHFDFHYGYFLPWKDQMVGAIREQGGKVICFQATNTIAIMMRIRAVCRYVRETKIQLIHAHLPWAGIVARIVGRICNVPVLYTEHNKQERYHVATRLMNVSTMNLLTAVIAVSEDVSASIRRFKPALKPPVHVIVNGVNIDKFNRTMFNTSEIRRNLNIPEHASIIGTVAVFRFQKRLDLWMELAAKILKEKPDVHFVVVGDGPLKKELIQKKDSLVIGDSIHMPGLETEIRPYLAAFDIYMMCSVFEGLPIALLEAMAMECPVITTDAGGIKEVVRQQQDGLICGVNEPDVLVNFALSLLENDALRAGYGAMARNRVAESFSMQRMVASLEVVYRNAVTLKK